MVESLDTHTSVFVPAARVESHFGETPEHTGAVLRLADGHFYLTSIWFEGHSVGYSVLNIQPQQPRLPGPPAAALMK